MTEAARKEPTNLPSNLHRSIYEPVPVGARVRLMAVVPMGCGDELRRKDGSKFRGCGVFVGNGTVVANSKEGRAFKGEDYQVKTDDGVLHDFAKERSLGLHEL